MASAKIAAWRLNLAIVTLIIGEANAAAVALRNGASRETVSIARTRARKFGSALGASVAGITIATAIAIRLKARS